MRSRNKRFSGQFLHACALLCVVGTVSSGTGFASSPRFRPILDRSFASFELLKTDPEEWSAPVICGSDPNTVLTAVNGELNSVDVLTSKLNFSKKDVGATGQSMLCTQDAVLMMSSGQHLRFLDAHTGKDLKDTQVEQAAEMLNGAIAGEIRTQEGKAFFPVTPSSVVAVDLSAKKILWRVRETPTEDMSIRGQAPVGLDQAGRAFLGFSNGNLIAVWASTGVEIWRRQLGKERQLFSDIDAEPLLVHASVNNEPATVHLIAASYNKGMVWLDPETGTTRKEMPYMSISAWTKSLDERWLYAVTGEKELLSISTADGRVRWRYQAKRGTLIRPLLLSRSELLIPSREGGLVRVDAETGKPKEILGLRNGLSALPIIQGKKIFVLSDRAHLIGWEQR